MKRLGMLLGTLAVVMLVAGCGGGGSSSSATTAAVAAEEVEADQLFREEVAQEEREEATAAGEEKREAEEAKVLALAQQEERAEAVALEEREAEEEEKEKEADPGAVSSAEYGKKWPLKVAEGQLSCEGSEGFGSVVFTAPDATEYGLNGTAQDQLGLPAIDPIWRFEPGMAKYELRVNIGPLLDRGLALCE